MPGVHGKRAEPGNALILTSGLGTGILQAAVEEGRLDAGACKDAIPSLTSHDSRLDQLLSRHNVIEAVGVDSSGLAGIALKIADANEVSLAFEESDLPLLPDVLEMVRGGTVTEKGECNRSIVGPQVNIAEEVGSEMVEVFFDPQLPGGLLVVAPDGDAMPLLASLHELGYADAAIVGRVIARGKFAIELV
ncbi:MAG TPA: AIR synthase-related protein [Candidatus Binataceae bacterium]|nr:AIR synthase-related protein [Candidatus Binataceae bacterium]